jgi:hypothetical protein
VGGFRNMRHDNINQTFAQHARLVYRDVETEPRLQVVPEILRPLMPKGANIEDEARSA